MNKLNSYDDSDVGLVFFDPKGMDREIDTPDAIDYVELLDRMFELPEPTRIH